MQRRGENGQPVKSRRHRATTPKARDAPTASVSPADLQKQLDRRTHERDEALEQLAATSEVLQVISSSPGKLEPVFQAMLEKATNLSGSKFGNLYLHKEGGLHLAAAYNSPLALVEERARAPFRPKANTPPDRMVRTKSVVHIVDLTSDESYLTRDPRAVSGVELGGVRTLLLVPMLKDVEVVGHFAIFRQEVRPFTDRQVELVKNFAAQAVIAIENTRLLNELRQRTDDLTESLEQQMATSDVLRVISSSPTNVQPVFDSIAESAVRLCDGQFSFVLRFDGKVMDFASCCGLSAEGLDAFHSILPMPASEDTASGRAIVRRAVVEIPDVAADPSYGARGQGLAKAVTYRSIAAVPLLDEGNPIGAIAVARANAGSFPKRQIMLLQAFADQAVIAIKNVRMFDEVQARTRDLSEALQQQTATADVLKVISSSPGELDPVFNAMLANATRICEATFGNLFLREGSVFRSVAVHSPQGHVDSWRRNPVFDLRDNPGVPLDRVATTKQVVHITDLRTDQSYVGKNARVVTLVEVTGARTYVSVPMLKEGEIIGAISMFRREVRPFTNKQIELVQNFAAQAVIAIENTRLLNELRESLQQQTATADVLKVISSSPGDLEPVFNAMLEKATHICEAKFGLLLRFDGEMFRFAAEVGTPPALAEFQRERGPFQPVAGSHLERVMRTKKVSHTVDYAAEGILSPPVTLGGARSTVDVPLLKDNELIGVFSIYRQEVRPFTDKQIELVKNFAAQAVIAIENTRLLSELRQRTDDLSESLEQQTATSEVLKVISSSPGELEPVFNAMLENATRICQAKYGIMFLHENGTLRASALCGVPPALAEERQRNPRIRPPPKTGLGIVLQTKKTAHVADVLAEPQYFDVPAGFTRPAIVQFGGARTELAVPMLKESELVGAIAIQFPLSVRPSMFHRAPTQLCLWFICRSAADVGAQFDFFERPLLFFRRNPQTRTWRAILFTLGFTNDSCGH